MLQLNEFDIKTGKSLQRIDPATGNYVPRTKDIEYSYLEEWLQQCFFDPADMDGHLSVAKYYDGIQTYDIENLAVKGKELVFTSGSWGFFASPEIADVLMQQPIFDPGEASAHNAVAYGSLIVSDGYSQTKTKGGTTRILVVDNRNRSIGGSELLTEYDPIKDISEQLTAQEIDKLLDILGDGTMLVGTPTVRELLLPEEVSKGIARVFRRKDIELDPIQKRSLLSQYLEQGFLDRSTLKIYGIKPEDIDQEIDRLANETVVQFRAAVTNVPGLMKGTCQTSSWCARLGVDAVVSLDNVKGSQKGGFYSPGIQQQENGDLWINRKKFAKYAYQSVGPQVKGKVPEATLRELNPKSFELAKQAAALAVDPYALGQKLVSKVEKRQGRPLFEPDDLDPSNSDLSTSEALATVLKADKYGQLTLLPTVDEQLTRTLSRQWKDAATHGITLPSAMAQHHNALKPWEVCNRDLPEGAIVVYYRSPFGNVGAAAVAINNLQVISAEYPESFQKSGVCYLPPWSAEQIAITDFDSDYNGFFVAGVVTDLMVMQKMREQFINITDPQQQYDAALAYIDNLINIEGALISAPEHYPMTVREFVVQNRPENRSLPIPKAKKILHPMLPGEAQSTSIGKAWIKTAENPVGIVANLSMILESLSQNITYSELEDRKSILEQVVQAFRKIDPDVILTDEELVAAGLPPLGFQDRIKASLANISQEDALIGFSDILQDAATYPLAKNLQLAVDIAKSAQGIVDRFQDFSRKLAYQSHDLRRDFKSQEVYRIRELNNNTVDPVGINVDMVNELYSSIPSKKIDREGMNVGFRQIMPRIYSPQELEQVNELVEQYRILSGRLRSSIERLKNKNKEDLQPTFALTSDKTGKTITVQRICDAQKINNYDLTSLNEVKNFNIAPNTTHKSQIEKFPFTCLDEDGNLLGYISTATLNQAGLFDHFYQIVNNSGEETFLITAAAEIFPPYALQNDKEAIYEEMQSVLSHIRGQFDGREHVLASALWTSSTGMGIALKIAPQEIIDQLNRVPDVQLYGGSIAYQNLKSHANLRVRFDLAHIDGVVTPIASLLSADGIVEPLGVLSRNTSNLAPGTVVNVDLVPVTLDPKIRIKAHGQSISIHPSAEFDRLIDPTRADFEFRDSDNGIEAYQVGMNGLIYLGSVDQSSESKITVGSLMVGEYSRGKFKSKSGEQCVLNIRSLVEHQPVSSDLPEMTMEGRILADKLLEIEYEPPTPLIYLDDYRSSLLAAEPTAKFNAEEKFTPTRGQIKNYYRAAVLLGLPKKTLDQIVAIGQAQVAGIPAEKQTDEFINPATVLIAEEYQAMENMVDQILVPTRGQLIQWYIQAVKAGNKEQIKLVAELGQRQIADTSEASKPDNERNPSFRNPNFRLKWSEAENMSQAGQQQNYTVGKIKAEELQR